MWCTGGTGGGSRGGSRFPAQLRVLAAENARHEAGPARISMRLPQGVMSSAQLKTVVDALHA